MIKTDGAPTIAWYDGDPGDETDHVDHRPVPAPRPHKITLSDEELHLLINAVDSHAYWQLSDTHYRNNGFVNPPGSDDPETAQEIAVANALGDRLLALAQGD